MKSTELMIGDIILLFDKTPVKVDAIGDTEVYVHDEMRTDWNVGYEHIKPIPLTPEILEKNGFKKDDDVWPRYGFVSDIENCPQTVITFSFYGKGVSAETLFRCWTKPKSCDGENNIHICDLKYVHELQHALRLCGIDKEITI